MRSISSIAQLTLSLSFVWMVGQTLQSKSLVSVMKIMAFHNGQFFFQKKKSGYSYQTNCLHCAMLELFNEYINTVVCSRSQGTNALYRLESQGMTNAD